VNIYFKLSFLDSFLHKGRLSTWPLWRAVDAH